jgi:hypothetical protein
MTIALQLDPSGYSALKTEAAELGITPEQLANEIVQRHLRERSQAASDSANDPAFMAALSASMKENEELLRRLAK